jgi:hypothetical protein
MFLYFTLRPSVRVAWVLRPVPAYARAREAGRVGVLCHAQNLGLCFMTSSRATRPKSQLALRRGKGSALERQILLPAVMLTEHPAVIKTLTKNQEYSYDVDPESLFELALTHASFQQMAAILKVPVYVLEADDVNRGIIDRARAVQKTRLRSAQFASAITDRNAAMQIWLGKQLLGQKDRHEAGDEFRGRVNVGVSVRVMMPANARNPLPPGPVKQDQGELASVPEVSQLPAGDDSR